MFEKLLLQFGGLLRVKLLEMNLDAVLVRATAPLNESVHGLRDFDAVILATKAIQPLKACDVNVSSVKLDVLAVMFNDLGGIAHARMIRNRCFGLVVYPSIDMCQR